MSLTQFWERSAGFQIGAWEEKPEKEVCPPKKGEVTAPEALSAVVTSAPLVGWERTDLPTLVLCPVLPSKQPCKGGSLSLSLYTTAHNLCLGTSTSGQQNHSA